MAHAFSKCSSRGPLCSVHYSDPNSDPKASLLGPIMDTTRNCTRSAAHLISFFSFFPLAVILVLAFLICWLPFHVGRIMYINPKNTRMMLFSQYFNVFALQLFYLSATINPILYNLVSNKYRAALYKLLLTKRRPERASTITRETAGYLEITG